MGVRMLNLILNSSGPQGEVDAQMLVEQLLCEDWRRGGDSNPRYGF